MKDYRLSEIKEYCALMHGNGGCMKCRFYPHLCLEILSDIVPNKWDIEPRDMIELPCKIPMIAINEQALAYQVVYRSVLGTGEIVTRVFDNETDADVFLIYCKRRNNLKGVSDDSQFQNGRHGKGRKTAEKDNSAVYGKDKIDSRKRQLRVLYQVDRKGGR